MILKQETVSSLFGIGDVVQSEIIKPFSNAEQIIKKYNLAIEHNSLTQKGWERLLNQSDDGLRNYLTHIKGSTASMTGYTTSLEGNISGFKKVSSAISQYNKLSSQGISEQKNLANAVSITNNGLGSYLSKLNGAKASMGGYIKSLISATAKSLTLKAATLALNVSISAIASLFVTKLITAIDNFNERFVRAAENAGEALDTVKSDVSELSELIKEYNSLQLSNEWDNTNIETKKQLQKDINALLDDEADKLDIVNGKYEEVTAELYKQKLAKLSEQEKSAYDALEAEKDVLWNENKYNNLSFKYGSIRQKDDEATYYDDIDTLKKYLAEYDDVLVGWKKTSLSANSKTDAFIGTQDPKNVDELITQYDRLKQLSQEMYDNGDTGAFYESINNYLDEIEERVENVHIYQIDFDTSKAANDLGKILTDSNNGFGGYIETLEEYQDIVNFINNSDFDNKETILEVLSDDFPEFSTKLNNVKSSIVATKLSLENLVSSSESLKDSLDNTFSNQDKFQSALDKIREGTSLSADEMLELADLYPELASKFQQTADGWTITSQDLIDANGNVVKSTKESIQEQIKLYEEYIKQLQREEARKVILSQGFIPTDALEGQLKHFDFSTLDMSGNEEFKKTEEAIAGLELWMKVLGVTTDETADELTKLKESISDNSKEISDFESSMKTMSDAFEEQQTNGKLSAQTILDIIDAGYTSALMFDKETGAVTINKNAYLALAKAKIAEQKAELLIDRQEISNSLIEENNRLRDLTTGYLKVNDAALELAKTSAIINDNTELLDSIDGQIIALDELEQEIDKVLNGTYSDTGGSSGDPIKAAFDKQMRDTEHAYAKGLISQEEYLNKLEEENEEHYKNSAEHYDDYLANIEKIYNGRKDIFKSTVDEQIKALDEQLEKGFISPAQYQSEMIKLMEQSYGMGSKYYGTEFATENYNEMSDTIEDKDVDVYESKLDELKKANDGSIEAERQFIEKWKSLNKKMFEDSDPKKYKENLEEIAEYEDDWLVRRAENEKTYWENLKQEVEDYYDKEIEKLQSILDEEEKINKQEELRNNLIKARQDLENAKKNKNQLVFVDGMFKYVEDQEAVEQAAEAEKDTQRELERYETEQEIALLQEEQKKKIDDIDDVINRIEQYLKELNGETDPTTSDTEVIVSANAVEEAKKAKNSYDSISETNNGSNTTVTPEDVGKVFTDSTTEWTEQFANVLNVLGLANANLDAMKNFFTGDTHLQTMSNPSTNTIGGQIVYNNSTVNNDNRQVINIGDINMTIEGDSSEQMLREFASKLGSTIQSITGRIT